MEKEKSEISGIFFITSSLRIYENSFLGIKLNLSTFISNKYIYCVIFHIIFSFPEILYLEFHWMKPLSKSELKLCFSFSPSNSFFPSFSPSIFLFHYISCSSVCEYVEVIFCMLSCKSWNICRWEVWEGNFCFAFLLWFVNLSSSFFSLKVNDLTSLYCMIGNSEYVNENTYPLVHSKNRW